MRDMHSGNSCLVQTNSCFVRRILYLKRAWRTFDLYSLLNARCFGFPSGKIGLAYLHWLAHNPPSFDIGYEGMHSNILNAEGIGSWLPDGIAEVAGCYYRSNA